ncbi:MAG: CotH kinase family protein [Flavobacteriales bacterium]
MKNLLFLLAVCLLLIGSESCYKEKFIPNAELFPELEKDLILKLNNKECGYDYQEEMLRFSIENQLIANFSPFVEYSKSSSLYFEGTLLNNNEINNLGTIEINTIYEVEIETNGTRKKYELSFTNLPIVQIIVPSEIQDMPKKAAKITLNFQEENKASDQFYIGIEHRGGSSQFYDKKSFGFALKRNPNLSGGYSASLFDLKPNNDWILDAMWIDEARLRNKTSFELWQQLSASQHSGINGEFVELFINNEHQGLYCLNENMNSEFLNLEGSDGVLYKAINWEDGATRFETYSSDVSTDFYWDGWEQKYPQINTNWSSLSNLRNLVVNGNDSIFSSSITSLIDINNFADYYIFLNLVMGLDNTGKNTYLWKETSGSKFKVIPWDLDGTWGIFWDGNTIGPTSILSNNLYDRLIRLDTDNFKNKLKQRWTSLRAGIFSTTNLKKAFDDNFALINKQNIVPIENKKWQSTINYQNEQQYLLNWLDNRVIYLDNYFTNL